MKRSRYALALAIAGNFGLIAALFVIADATTGALVLAALFTLPLLASLNGLIRARIYTAAWASMMALFYLAYAMVEYIAGAATIGVDLCLAASLTLFIGCVVFAKWAAREKPAVDSD